MLLSFDRCTGLYVSITVEALTGTAPDASAYTIFSSGDPVIATSVGGAGGRWITLAKLFGSRSNEQFVTDLVGDLGTIPTPFIGDYTLDATTVPDCTSCAGTTCLAMFANVRVLSGGKQVSGKALRPGESSTYNGRNDGSRLSFTFVKGQALSATCADKTGTDVMSGPQAISVYIVKVVPPISAAQPNIRTAPTTRLDEALIPLAPDTTGTLIPVSSPVPTTKVGMLPLAVIGVVAFAGLVLVMKKE